jgi:hypothetical protein
MCIPFCLYRITTDITLALMMDLILGMDLIPEMDLIITVNTGTTMDPLLRPVRKVLTPGMDPTTTTNTLIHRVLIRGMVPILMDTMDPLIRHFLRMDPITTGITRLTHRVLLRTALTRGMDPTTTTMMDPTITLRPIPSPPTRPIPSPPTRPIPSPPTHPIRETLPNLRRPTMRVFP